MFGVLTKITVTQVSTDQYPNRNKFFVFDFCVSSSVASTWASLTDVAKVVLPRAIFFVDSLGNKTTWADTQIYGNPDKAPLILRGDKIKIETGYSFFKPTGTTFNRKQIVKKLSVVFDGYITKIQNKTPIKLTCEDSMYALKQTKVRDKVHTGSMEQMLKEMISESTFPDAKLIVVKTDNYTHNMGKFITQNVTMAQVLDELRKNYHLESFIRKEYNDDNSLKSTELRCGIIRYYPEDKKSHQFHFQKTIISDNLEYTREDDIRIGIKAFSINKVELNSTNSSGKNKLKKTRLETTVGDTDGEIRTLYFTEIDNIKELKAQAEKKLPFIKYEGFRGSFTTFGLPKVKHGDECQLINDKLPERNGSYLVKEVKEENTKDGLRQIITLDIRIDGMTPNQISEFQSNGA